MRHLAHKPPDQGDLIRISQEQFSRTVGRAKNEPGKRKLKTEGKILDQRIRNRHNEMDVTERD